MGRFFHRVEPAFWDVILQFNKTKTRGKVLDSSLGGMAINVPDHEGIPKPEDEKEKAEIHMVRADSEATQIRVGTGKVKRLWDSDELSDYSKEILDNGKGVALQFDNPIESDELKKYLLNGIKQKIRLARQVQLAKADILYLGEYRRDLIKCQITLFTLNLTIGVALAGAYFGLMYGASITSQPKNPDLSFWRAMMAILPGYLSIACSLMVSQKCISIRRVDSFLLLLKKYSILNQFPREYRGWEDACRKYRNALKSKACKFCEIDPKCGELRSVEQMRLNESGLLIRPWLDLYHTIIFATFFGILGLSMIAIVWEISAFNWKPIEYMAVAILVLLVISVAIYVLWIFKNLRKGIHSFEANRRNWVDILNRCRLPV